MASNFLYSTREQKFILKEWLDMSRVFETGRFKGGYSIDDIDSILENAMKIAKEVVGPYERRRRHQACRIQQTARSLFPNPLKRLTGLSRKTAWVQATATTPIPAPCRYA